MKYYTSFEQLKRMKTIIQIFFRFLPYKMVILLRMNFTQVLKIYLSTYFSAEKACVFFIITQVFNFKGETNFKIPLIRDNNTYDLYLILELV